MQPTDQNPTPPQNGTDTGPITVAAKPVCTAPAIQTHALTKRYGSTLALDSLELTVHRGWTP